MKVKLMLIMLLSAFTLAIAKEGVVTDKITVNVKGMTCQNCVHKVETALESLDGISDARVSLKNGTATIIYSKDKVNTKDIRKAIRKAGFEYIGTINADNHGANCSGSCCTGEKIKL